MADDFDKRYPLHAKVVAVRDEKNVLEKFLRWLETNETFRLVRADGAGIPDETLRDQFGRSYARVLRRLEGEGLRIVPTEAVSPRPVLHAYFEIDERAFAEEKDRMFAEMAQGVRDVPLSDGGGGVPGGG